MSEGRWYYEDEALGKALDWSLLKRLAAYLRPYRLRVGIALALLILQAGLGVLPPWIVKHAIDDKIAGGDAGGLYVMPSCSFSFSRSPSRWPSPARCTSGRRTRGSGGRPSGGRARAPVRAWG